MKLRTLASLTAVSALVGISLACTPVAADLNDDPGKTKTPGIADTDSDGVPDDQDNCVDVANADQVDVDSDSIGDACDDLVDQDADGIADDLDNCMLVGNADQADDDMDGYGDLCDNCPADSNADQIDVDGDGIGDACPCDACGATQWCTEHPTLGASCSDDCHSESQAADQKCCPLGSKPDSVTGECEYADLFVDQGRLEGSLCLDTQSFNANSCEFIEGCINGTGQRNLLKFDTTTPNEGIGDLHVGDPDENPQFVWSPCHGHYHFESYAAYEVQDDQGNVVAPGHKQAFCLMDFEPWTAGWGSGNGYNCGYQGISTGWADTYGSYLDCQFVDITDVPDQQGQYTLQIHVNHEELVAESDYSDNVLQVSVDLGSLPQCN